MTESVVDALLSMLVSADRRLPVKLVVLDNGGFECARVEIVEAGVQPYGISFTDPDWAKVAESVGLAGIRVREPRTVRDAVAGFSPSPGRRRRMPSSTRALSDPRPRCRSRGGGFSLSLAEEAPSGNLDDVIGPRRRACTSSRPKGNR